MPFLLSSLKLRIVALCVGTGLVAAAGTGGALLHATEHSLQTQLLASDRLERERTASLLGSKLDTLKAAVAAIASHTSRELLADGGKAGAFLLDKPAAAVLFDGIFVARADGTMLARVEGQRLVSELPPIGDRSYFRRAMSGDQPVVSDPLVGRASGRPLLIVAAPVLGADGKAIGVVGGSLRLQSTGLFADPSGERGDGVRDLVIDRAGTILSHSDAGRILGRAREERGLEAVYRRWSEAGSPIETHATSELDASDLVSTAGIPFSEWMLVRLTSRTRALAPLAEARRTAIGAALLVGVLASLLAGWAAWAIVRPIGLLHDKIERMLRHDESAAVDWPEQTGEVAAMATAFRTLLQEREGQRAEAQMLLVRLQAVIDNAEVGIALVREHRLELVNQPFCRMVGRPREALVGEPASTVHLSTPEWKDFGARARAALDEQGRFDGECELYRGDGRRFWARLRARAIVAGNRGQGSIWVIEDATAEKDQRERLSWAASHDRLTGLMNRAAFEVLLDDAVAAAGEAPFCALFIDLDRFKQVNDTGGHAIGDAVLQGLAKTLLDGLRRTDTIARLGGDEFAVILPRCPVVRGRAIAESLRGRVEAFRFASEGRVFAVGASIGLVAVDGRHASSVEVLRDADAACYEAKRSGRDRVVTAGAS